MVLIVLGVFIILPFQVSSFTTSNCRDFIANDEWPPTSIHWIIRFGTMLESFITGCNRSQNNSRVIWWTSAYLVCLTI